MRVALRAKPPKVEIGPGPTLSGASLGQSWAKMLPHAPFCTGQHSAGRYSETGPFAAEISSPNLCAFRSA
jgi:hypothetical protein